MRSTLSLLSMFRTDTVLAEKAVAQRSHFEPTLINRIAEYQAAPRSLPAYVLTLALGPTSDNREN
jgi:hypothetical protein